MCTFNGLWIGPVNDLCRLSVASYVATGHKYRLWTYDNVYIPGAEICDARAIVSHAVYERWQQIDEPHRWQTFANYFRFKLIHKYGGWWADLDSVSLRSHNVEEDYIFSGIDAPTREQLKHVVQQKCGNIINGCFKAPKGAPFLAKIVEQLDSLGFQQANCPAFAVWGVVAFTSAIYEFGLQHYKADKPIFAPIPPRDANLLYEKQLLIPDWAYSVHFYNWITNGQKPGGTYQDLYERYLTEYVL